jgi:hypothetical protein
MTHPTLLLAALLFAAVAGTAQAGALEEYMHGLGPPPGVDGWSWHRQAPPQHRGSPGPNPRASAAPASGYARYR